MRILTLILVMSFGCLLSAEEGVKIKKIAILGDSLSAGVNASLDGEVFGWVQMLKNESRKGIKNDGHHLYQYQADIQIENFSVIASTAYEWRGEILLPVLDYQPDILIINIGANDIINGLKNGYLTDDYFKKIYQYVEEIIIRVKAVLPECRIMINDIPDLFEGQSARLPDYLKEYRDFSVYSSRSYEIIKGYCEKYQLIHVDFSPFLKDHGYGLAIQKKKNPNAYFRYPLFQFDIHPNTEGHRKMKEIYIEYLKPFLTK